jgi:prepilin-type N-terminal cleavage/methylation domain-containing protein
MVEQIFMKKGFTLLELLVVIAIAAILVGIASASYTSAQKKARDAKRMGDMHSIQNAAEQFYADNASSYPANEGGFTSTYLPGGFPRDPKASPYEQYYYNPTATGYTMCSRLENTGTGNATSLQAAGYPTTGGNYFCVKNLQ